MYDDPRTISYLGKGRRTQVFQYQLPWPKCEFDNRAQYDIQLNCKIDSSDDADVIQLKIPSLILKGTRCRISCPSEEKTLSSLPTETLIDILMHYKMMLEKESDI
jgi:hypothetical protein